MDEMKIAGTGHRPHKLPGKYQDFSAQRAKLRDLMHRTLVTAPERQGVDISVGTTKLRVITGGALGVDQDLARVAYMHGWPYDVYVPCWNQESRWPKEAQDRYKKMLDLAREWHYVHDGPYTATCMQERNIAMVDDCDALLAVIIPGTRSGGTFNCVQYAISQNKPIIYVNPLEAA